MWDYAPGEAFRLRKKNHFYFAGTNLKSTHLHRNLPKFPAPRFTGTASEDFRIVSYTPGGHIHPHFDRTPGQEQHKTLHMFPFATLVIYVIFYIIQT
ncbi:unnamed protein product [Allacma fusca]|uniref:Uncharacterized protein n=1 Tax=Allacma fusca TaxID=39272 RepID=A0A8J2PU49_9HEXA|nr:unnamed protein product [Allacma fusca]